MSLAYNILLTSNNSIQNKFIVNDEDLIQQVTQINLMLDLDYKSDTLLEDINKLIEKYNNESQLNEEELKKAISRIYEMYNTFNTKNSIALSKKKITDLKLLKDNINLSNNIKNIFQPVLCDFFYTSYLKTKDSYILIINPFFINLYVVFDGETYCFFKKIMTNFDIFETRSIRAAINGELERSLLERSKSFMTAHPFYKTKESRPFKVDILDSHVDTYLLVKHHLPKIAFNPPGENFSGHHVFMNIIKNFTNNLCLDQDIFVLSKNNIPDILRIVDLEYQKMVIQIHSLYADMIFFTTRGSQPIFLKENLSISNYISRNDLNRIEAENIYSNIKENVLGFTKHLKGVQDYVDKTANTFIQRIESNIAGGPELIYSMFNEYVQNYFLSSRVENKTGDK